MPRLSPAAAAPCASSWSGSQALPQQRSSLERNGNPRGQKISDDLCRVGGRGGGVPHLVWTCCDARGMEATCQNRKVGPCGVREMSPDWCCELCDGNFVSHVRPAVFNKLYRLLVRTRFYNRVLHCVATSHAYTTTVEIQGGVCI